MPDPYLLETRTFSRPEMLMSFLDTDEKRARRLVHVPMGRFGQASEMANAALFLASDSRAT